MSGNVTCDECLTSRRCSGGSTSAGTAAASLVCLGGMMVTVFLRSTVTSGAGALVCTGVSGVSDLSTALISCCSASRSASSTLSLPSLTDMSRCSICSLVRCRLLAGRLSRILGAGLGFTGGGAFLATAGLDVAATTDCVGICALTGVTGEMRLRRAGTWRQSGGDRRGGVRWAGRRG